MSVEICPEKGPHFSYPTDKLDFDNYYYMLSVPNRVGCFYCLPQSIQLVANIVIMQSSVMDSVKLMDKMASAVLL